MRFARQHPYYGWLFLEPDDYRRIYNQLIQMRDADLKKGDDSSGFPSGFAEWCEDDLKDLAKENKYQKRIKDHLNQLKISIENRKRELANTYLAEELKKMESKAELIEGLVGS